MFTHAIETNVIITFIKYSNNVALTNVTVWNYTIVRIFLRQIRFLVRFNPNRVTFSILLTTLFLRSKGSTIELISLSNTVN